MKIKINELMSVDIALKEEMNIEEFLGIAMQLKGFYRVDNKVSNIITTNTVNRVSHPKIRLTPDEIDYIVKSYREGKRAQDIARDLNKSDSTITNVINRIKKGEFNDKK